MQATDKILLEFVARLAYNVDGLSGELKLYFSYFLTSHFFKTLSREQIEDVENGKASKPLSDEDWQKAASIFSKEQKVLCGAALYLLQKQAEKIDDRIASRKIGKLSNELISFFDLQNERSLVDDKRSKIERSLQDFQHRVPIKIPSKIWPLALDYAIRFGFLLYASFWQVDNVYLILSNVFFIPIFILLLAYTIGRLQKKANLKLLEAYGGANTYKIEYQVSVTQYTWLAFFWGSSIFIGYLLPDQLHVSALFGLTFYYFLYLRFFRIGFLGENELVRQLEHKPIDTTTLSIDENDEVIIALETKLNSSTSRLEAYVLESTLFGALTFSGFLQIVATDLVSFKDLENFAAYIFSTAQGFIHFDWPLFNQGVAGLNDKKSLLCLVSVESLICSIFFLAVIASRLRFSDIADKVRTALNLAKAYNTKEEALFDELEKTRKTTSRLEALTAKVNDQLYQATLVLDEIHPVMQYMQYFRNAGILVFLIILISSSLFITSLLGWTFLFLALATYLYFNRTQISTQIKTYTFNLRIEFIKRSYWLLTIAFAPQVVGFTLRVVFQIKETEWLFALSYFLFGVYLAAWLVLAAHVDESFGQIETNTNELERQIRWKFVKNVFAVCILAFAIGMALKQLQIEHANVFLILSVGGGSLLMYFIGYYLTKERWLGVFYGCLMAISSLGFCFRLFHWEGANQMRLLGIGLSIVLIPIAVWKRQLFHSLMIRFYVATVVIGLYYSPFFQNAIRGLNYAYDHGSVQIQPIRYLEDANQANLFLTNGSKAVDLGVKISDAYIKQYGTDFGFTNAYSQIMREYEEYILTVLTRNDNATKKDSSLLLLGLKIAQQHYKVAKLFSFDAVRYVPLEAEVFLAMGKRDEAIRSLEKVIPFLRNEQEKEEMKAKLVFIKNGGQKLLNVY